MFVIGEASNTTLDRIASYSILREEAMQLARMNTGHRNSFWRARRAGLAEYVDSDGIPSEAVSTRFRLTAMGWARFALVEAGCKLVLGIPE